MKFMDDDDDDNAIICLCDIQTQRETITIQSYCSDSNYNGYNDGRVGNIFLSFDRPSVPETATILQ